MKLKFALLALLPAIAPGLAHAQSAPVAQSAKPAARVGILGDYDPATGRFTPVAHPAQAGATIHDDTITFKPVFDFKYSLARQYSTISCTVSVSYNGHSFGSATNQFDPSGKITPISLNIKFLPDEGASTVLDINFKCTAYSSTGVGDNWEEDVSNSSVGEMNYTATITY